jgi:hypothetical protein
MLGTSHISENDDNHTEEEGDFSDEDEDEDYQPIENQYSQAIKHSSQAKKDFRPPMSSKSNVLKKTKDDREGSKTKLSKAAMSKLIKSKPVPKGIYLLRVDGNDNKATFRTYEAIEEDNNEGNVVVFSKPGSKKGSQCTCSEGQETLPCRHKIFCLQAIGFEWGEKADDTLDIMVQRYLNSFEFQEIIRKLSRKKKEGLVNLIKIKHKWDQRYFLGKEQKKMRQCDNQGCNFTMLLTCLLSRRCMLIWCVKTTNRCCQ